MRRFVRPLAAASSLLVLCFCVVVGLLVPGATAHSRQRNPLRTIARVEDPVLHTPSHRVHAFSSFQLSFTLHQVDTAGDDDDRRLPIRLRLEPNHDILAEDASVSYAGEDGSVVAVEPVRRHDHRVFVGHAFVQTGHVLADGTTNDNHWINAGWASVYVHADGDHPVFEGAFHLGGDHHHIQTRRNYLDTRLPGDPLLPSASSDDDHSMVVWRDSDILPDAAVPVPWGDAPSTGDELRRRHHDLLDGNASVGAVEAGATTACSADGLLFNTDDMHPIYRGIDVVGGDRAAKRATTGTRWLFGRQIDGSGDNGGGNSGGVNLASTIGNPSGCPTTRKVALMGVAIDCNYANAFPTPADARANVIQQISSASRVYENTFNITLGIQDVFVQNGSCPTSPKSSATPWNADCTSGNLTITDRLNLFSKWRGESTNDTNAFWMLVSTCATDSAVGLAWLGQLCVPGSQADGSSGETIAATNVVVRTPTEWQVMAHETGHTFGAVHDCTSQTCSDGTVTRQQCCPLSGNSCSANGQFIMNPSTGSGITQFSACTVGNICSAMGRNSVRPVCLSNNKNVVTATGSVCGNGIVEEGEQCDCGGTEGCGSNTCCDPTTCKFTTNALCDPANDECCTSSCQLANAGTVCRPSTGSCDPAETCSGTTAACPANVNAPDGTTCGGSGTGLTCASGQCTSRSMQCKTLMGSLTTSNDTYACSSQGCQISCSSPQFGPNTCLMMNQNFLDGTPCEGGGHCSNGKCQGVSVAKEAADAIRNNLDITIPVAVVVGILVLLAVSSCVWSVVRRRQSRRRLQELARSGMPPPPRPPPRNGVLRRSAAPSRPRSGGWLGRRGLGPADAPKPEGEASPTAMLNAQPRSGWAFWKKKNDPNANAGNNTQTAGMAFVGTPPGYDRPPPVNTAAWRASGYGAGPRGPGVPPPDGQPGSGGFFPPTGAVGGNTRMSPPPYPPYNQAPAPQWPGSPSPSSRARLARYA
ncbi:metalloprotease [Niveomyces insectorum RCEF 264]|uniref:Disintegrin and metalloproteinase domain-containing protein B n=1 Tax=Niveomyces insectorum RCEF 264 TaxID=1081102 RepID=A0A167Z759_9HYPO|nr:metalloprotease [Niveomyces insectorum RCEF 264]